METEKPSEPDSTTLERDVRQQFRKDEDVLCLNKKDGCFYLGTIVQVDNVYKKCLVEFLDNTQVWSAFKDLKSFAPQEPEMCYYCERSQYRDENSSGMCTCGREAQHDESEVNSSTEYYGRGLVKRSTPFPVSDQSNNLDSRFRSHAVRRARRLLNKNLKRKKKAVRKSVLEPARRRGESQNKKTSRWSYKSFPRTFEEFLELRKRKMELDSSEEQQHAPEVRKRPQRNLLEARLNSTESKLYNPFTAVDPDSRKSRSVAQDGGSSSKRSENSSSKKSRSHKAKSSDKQKSAKSKLVQKTLFDSFSVSSQEKSTRQFELVPLVSRCKVKDKDSDQASGDSKSNSLKSGRGRRSVTSESLDMMDSSDDETSSRGTLEPFIPTPKDFEGQNHPFRTVTDLISFPSTHSSSNPPITLPLPLKTVISQSDPPRLKKRQLSEEDIIVDRNGQVKRRRHRYRRNGSFRGGGTRDSGLGTTAAAKSAQITAPGKTKKTLQPLVSNGDDFALNSRQLRGRDTLRMVEKPMPRPVSLKPSPTKETTAEDLESSVKYFFGPAGRILSGEKYEIRAKRITFDGRIQCIIDWKGIPL